MILHIHSPPQKSPNLACRGRLLWGLPWCIPSFLQVKNLSSLFHFLVVMIWFAPPSVNSLHVDIVTSRAEARNIMGRKERYLPTILCTNYLMGQTAEKSWHDLQVSHSDWIQNSLLPKSHQPTALKARMPYKPLDCSYSAGTPLKKTSLAGALLPFCFKNKLLFYPPWSMGENPNMASSQHPGSFMTTLA